MSELQERTFHSENDKRRFTLSFSPDRLFFISRDEAISVAEDILDRYKPAQSAEPERVGEGARSLGFLVKEWAEREKILLGPHTAASLADALDVAGYHRHIDAARPRPSTGDDGALSAQQWREAFERGLDELAVLRSRAERAEAIEKALREALDNAAAQIESLALSFQSHGIMEHYDRALKCAYAARAALRDSERKRK